MGVDRGKVAIQPVEPKLRALGGRGKNLDW